MKYFFRLMASVGLEKKNVQILKESLRQNLMTSIMIDD